jgi:hypothetical protein
MLKVHADKTFSASPPDLEKPLESDGLLSLKMRYCSKVYKVVKYND